MSTHLVNQNETNSLLLLQNHKTCKRQSTTRSKCTSFLRTKSRIIRVSYPHSLQTPGPSQRGQTNSFNTQKMTPGVVSPKQIQTKKPWDTSIPPFKRKANRMASPLRSSPKAVFTAFLSHPHSKLGTEPNDDERKQLRTNIQQ